VHFAHHGNVRHRQFADQAVQALCLTLVVNCVAAFNTGLLGPAIERLRADCFEVDDHDVSHLGPTMTEHINVHGRYHFGLHLTSRDRVRLVSDHRWEGLAGLQEGPTIMSTPRRAKRFLTAEQKYDLWQRMLTGQLTAAAAAAEAGVDRSTVMTMRKTARDGAIAALQASRPGRPKTSRAEATEVAGLRAEVTRLSAVIVEQAIELAALRGKGSWG